MRPRVDSNPPCCSICSIPSLLATRWHTCLQLVIPSGGLRSFSIASHGAIFRKSFPISGGNTARSYTACCEQQETLTEPITRLTFLAKITLVPIPTDASDIQHLRKNLSGHEGVGNPLSSGGLLRAPFSLVADCRLGRGTLNIVKSVLNPLFTPVPRRAASCGLGPSLS